MGVEHFGIPQEMARSLVGGLQLTAAVETGTHLGDSARTLRQLVPEVWTIELSDDYLARARQRHADIDGIHFIHGDTSEKLPELAAAMTKPALYWLDAHWCGWNTAGEQFQCPILGELAAVDASPTAAESVLLIDDALSFLGGPAPEFRKGDFPSFIELVDSLRANYDRYITVLQDVIVAGPPRTRPVIEAYWQDEIARIRERHPVRARAQNLVLRFVPPDVYRRFRQVLKGR